MYTLKIRSVSVLSGRAVEYLALSHWNLVIYVVRSTEISDTMLYVRQIISALRRNGEKTKAF